MTSAYGLHVHNCVASNGNNNSFEIINNDGYVSVFYIINVFSCSVDNSLLGEVEYADGKILAHVRSHVFTFVNLKSLLFSCRVTLCLRDGDGCEGVSVRNASLIIYVSFFVYFHFIFSLPYANRPLTTYC